MADVARSDVYTVGRTKLRIDLTRRRDRRSAGACRRVAWDGVMGFVEPGAYDRRGSACAILSAGPGCWYADGDPVWVVAAEDGQS